MKMKNIKSLAPMVQYILLTLSLINIFFATSLAQDENQVKLGAYYFDGWTGKTYHISENLKRNFSDREPIWGWQTSTQEALDEQIKYAADAGLDFFSFCWYYTGVHGRNIQVDPKNNALKLFRSSKYKNKLKFNLMVANHGKYYTVKKEHWKFVTDYWCDLFIDPQYLRVDGKPLITFFNLGSLVETFDGSTLAVKDALNKFRDKAKARGLKGVSIAVCLDPRNKQHVEYAKRCGFDILTGYNFPQSSLKVSINSVIDINKLSDNEVGLWDSAKETKFPYIPVTTLNWDQRAWEDVNPTLRGAPRYKGFSSKSVEKSVRNLKLWILKNPEFVTNEKIGVIYAWNEYGEGAWLTPTKKVKNELLQGVNRAISQ